MNEADGPSASNCWKNFVVFKLACYFMCCKCICCKSNKKKASMDSEAAPEEPQLKKKLLVLGFDGAGKSALLQRWCAANDTEVSSGDSAIPSPGPTTGFNVQQVIYKNVHFDFWEVGGAEALRKYWFRYKDG